MVSRRVRAIRWWRRVGSPGRVLLFLASSVSLFLLVYLQRPREENGQFGSNFLVFLLVNLNIIILCILAFLVGRNVVKLIFDRRRDILGSRLRLRLVGAFVGLALVPTVILFVLASGLLTNAMEGWFSSQVEAAVSGAVEVAKHHYASLRETSREKTAELAQFASAEFGSNGAASEMSKFFEPQRQKRGFFSIRVIDRRKRVVLEVQNAAAVIANFSEPAPNVEAVEKALRKHEGVVFERKEAGQFVRAYFPFHYNNSSAVLMTSLRVEPGLSQALETVTDSYKEYEQLKLFKNPLRSSYLLTFAMITGLIIFSAIWIGFYLAKEITGPIQRIAEGTTEVARGNYAFQIRVQGDDELGFLARSFNNMTSDLNQSRREIERQQRYLETILSNLAVGVIGLNKERLITTINPAAQKIFGLEQSAVLQSSLGGVLNDEQYEQLRVSIDEVEASDKESRGVTERELTLLSNGRELKIVCTAGKIVDQSGNWSGSVLLFDDVTDLAKAQHMSAWREVVRRIAHEIKNPLTPIQLSAQRLEKVLAGTPDYPVVKESVMAIVENVDSIKRLANEFSHFARMPTAEFKAGDLNHLVADTVSFFAGQHPRLLMQFIADNRVPEIQMDREQVRRLLLNLFDNAAAAVGGESGITRNDGRIDVKTIYSQKKRSVVIEVADNGSGISEADKKRVFEPYFTTKKGGSGLGLAIVNSIIADHQGEIRVFDNEGRGTRFAIELPLEHGAPTQRRFSSGSA